jgi:hypothetical protein
VLAQAVAAEVAARQVDAEHEGRVVVQTRAAMSQTPGRPT